LVALAHKPRMTATAHASRDSSTVGRQRKPPRTDAPPPPSVAAAGKGEAQQAVVSLRQGGRHLSFVYEGLSTAPSVVFVSPSSLLSLTCSALGLP
jgi:hypothetical protein